MKKQTNKILIAFDFHRQSVIALQQITSIARFLKAEIVLVYVIEPLDMISQMFRKEDQLIAIHKELDAKLKGLAEITSEITGLSVTHRIENGKVYEAIGKLAEEINPRFIVMGKNDADEGMTRYIGSNATHIINESKCPVITIKGQEHKLGYKNIVVPLDLKKTTREKVFNAISFGLHYNATIWLVSVLKGGISFRQSRIYARLKKAQKTIQDNGVPCNIKLFKNSKMPDHEVILHYAEDIDADLIMIMTHQESGFRDHYIGKFAHEIINGSEIPVMTMVPAALPKQKRIVKSFVDPFEIFGLKKNDKLTKK
jgi:nucleotide-binding universal stress UspA family protein